MQTVMKRIGKTRGLAWLGCLSILLGTGEVAQVRAAEKVLVTYSVIELALPVADLEVYAKEGRLSPTLRGYAKYLQPEQLEGVREALNIKLELSPQVLARFLYTPTGETLLTRASSLVQPKSNQSGVQALRSAIILAATDPEGLTPLGLFRHYPEPSLSLDVSKGMEVLKSVQAVVQDTKTAIAAVDRQASIESRVQSPAAKSDLLALQKPGRLGWDVLALTLTDNRPQRQQVSNRVRTYPADVYIPRLPQPQPLPVVIISHGLGSDRLAFRYFAEHLASHGYIVAVPEHPGSSSQQLQALVDGRAEDVSRPTEFIHRPLDVSFLIDELLRRSESGDRLQGMVNPNAIGVMGQSFGGYTALALSGAQLTFTKLKEPCNSNAFNLNVSLLLQCQVLQLPEQPYQLADSRVKAALAINPIASHVFGQEGMQSLQRPTLVVGGTADTIAPVVTEQVEPFTWMPGLRKWLVLIEGATHFSTIDERRDRDQFLVTPQEVIGPTPQLARSYVKSIGLSFFDLILKNEMRAADWMTPASIQAQSVQPLPLSGVTMLTQDDLEKMRNGLW